MHYPNCVGKIIEACDNTYKIQITYTSNNYGINSVLPHLIDFDQLNPIKCPEYLKSGSF